MKKIFNLLVLTVLIIYIALPLHNLYFTGDALAAADNRIDGLYLPAGNYYVTTEQSAAAFEGATDSADAGVVVASCVIASECNQYAVTPLDIGLRDGHNSESNILSIRPLGKVNDLYVLISYDTEAGEASLYSVSIEESRSFRVVVALFVCIFLIFLEWMWFLFKEKRASFYRALALSLIVFIASAPLFTLHLIYGDDILFHTGRIDALADALGNGQFPVRIYTSLLNGYGYASPIFYGDILLYFPAVLYMLGMTLQGAYKCFVIAINIGTALIACYAFGKMFGKHSSITNSQVPDAGNMVSARLDIGVFGALIYTLSPYRLSDIYTRFAVGEYSAMMFLPLVAYGFWKILYDKHGAKRLRDCIPLVIGLSGILETHMLSCEMVAVMIILFLLINIRDVLRIDVIAAFVKTLILTALLNLWFIAPFLDFMQDDYSIHNAGRSSLQAEGLTIGGQAVYIIMFVALVGLYVLRHTGSDRVLISLIALGILALVFTSVYFPWDAIVDHSGVLSYYIFAMQFPWRYLSMATIFFTVALLAVVKTRFFGDDVGSTVSSVQYDSGLSASCGNVVRKSRGKRLSRNNVVCAAIATLFIAYAGFYYIDFFSNAIDCNITGNSDVEIYGLYTVSGGEYIPYGLDKKDCIERVAVADDNISEYSVTLENGITRLTVINDSGNAGDVRVPLVYYRHYQAIASDGSGETFVVSSSDDHFVSVEIPSGFSGTIDIAFKEPWFYRVAELISLVVLIAICSLPIITGAVTIMT